MMVSIEFAASKGYNSKWKLFVDYYYYYYEKTKIEHSIKLIKFKFKFNIRYLLFVIRIR